MPTVAPDFTQFLLVRPHETAAVQAWVDGRWADGFQCPHCGCDSCSQPPSMPFHRRCRGCHRLISPTAGTVLARTRTPHLIWSKAAFLLGSRGGRVNFGALAAELGVARRTAQRLVDRIRRGLRQANFPLREMFELGRSIRVPAPSAEALPVAPVVEATPPIPPPVVPPRAQPTPAPSVSAAMAAWLNWFVRLGRTRPHSEDEAASRSA